MVLMEGRWPIVTTSAPAAVWLHSLRLHWVLKCSKVLPLFEVELPSLAGPQCTVSLVHVHARIRCLNILIVMLTVLYSSTYLLLKCTCELNSRFRPHVDSQTNLSLLLVNNQHEVPHTKFSSCGMNAFSFKHKAPRHVWCFASYESTSLIYQTCCSILKETGISVTWNEKLRETPKTPAAAPRRVHWLPAFTSPSIFLCFACEAWHSSVF